MKAFITIILGIMLIAGDLFYLKRSAKRYNLSKGHNIEEVKRIIEQKKAMSMFTISVNIVAIGILFSWWEIDYICLLLLGVALIILNLSN